ncbi:uncharacterized protein PHACADRAFT_259191 [Phanerochaete carnosa HHB-10118-sp]|uniref:Uncharacterized protein n=1 Tax=Phanerochaete carnosa (strain HHB-10118-sp) TaxID=650164 RepID=K5VNH6_PHACS|nr:uncharacterized protein PHACADRAFT_259191 [Phanerochaete carnosa HHB-10118-sp]EKM53018.1 hypothetical protein PHACADRAFT_259191 [Phanerochaete carnosa HHB-10118-sp]
MLILKFNRCVIFVPKDLLNSKKCRSGEPHAQSGERWLRMHLAGAGEAEEQVVGVPRSND